MLAILQGYLFYFSSVVLFIFSSINFYQSAIFLLSYKEQLALFTTLHHMYLLHISHRANRCFIRSLTKLHKIPFYFQSWTDTVHRRVAITMFQMFWTTCEPLTFFFLFLLLSHLSLHFFKGKIINTRCISNIWACQRYCRFTSLYSCLCDG